MQQGTTEWYAARMGKVTSSRFGDVLTQPRSKADKEAGVIGETAKSYLFDLVGERLTGIPVPEYESAAMKRGKDLEPMARQAYMSYMMERDGYVVEQVGFFCLNNDPAESIGGSPDGLVGPDGLLEIKSPETYNRHVRVLVSGEMPAEHEEQVQGNLWVTGRQWADFVSYHPLFNQHALAVVRVQRDEKMIEKIKAAVTTFSSVLDVLTGALREYNGSPVTHPSLA